MLKNIPNILTLLRLILIVPFTMCFYHQEYIYAFYIFVIAGLTDALDGWLARFFHWQSTFGSFMDPIADKLLIAASVIALAMTKQLPWWFISLVFLRDITIFCGILAWQIYVKRNIIFQPTYISKINTLLQLTIITLSFYELAHSIHYNIMHNTLLIITTLTTSISYIDYVWSWGLKAYQTNTARS